MPGTVSALQHGRPGRVIRKGWGFSPGCWGLEGAGCGGRPGETDRNSLLQFSQALNFSEIATIQSHHETETVMGGETVVHGLAPILPLGAVFPGIVEPLEMALKGHGSRASQFHPDRVMKWEFPPYFRLPVRVYRCP